MSAEAASAARIDGSDLRSHTVEAYHRVLGGPGPDRPAGEPVALPGALNTMTVAEAYAFQHDVVAELERVWNTSTVGYKVSVTNEADQALIDATEPTSGVLTEGHLLRSGASVPLALANHPLVEPELLMRTTADIEPGTAWHDLASAVEVAGALEVPVSRFAGWWPPGGSPQLTLSGLIADNSVAGYVVMGETWRVLSSAEFGDVEVRLDLPQGDPVVGHASHVLGNPLRALAWLVDRLALAGQRLEVGSVVSTGTFAAPSRAQPGIYRAEFGAGLGAVVVTFD